MKMLLYTLDPPNGRCLLLAKQLQQVTSMAGSDCLQIVQRLFDSQHPREKPAVVDVLDSKSAGDLVATCVGLGIAIESEERESTPRTSPAGRA